MPDRLPLIDPSASYLDVVRKVHRSARCNYASTGRWEVWVHGKLLGQGKTASEAWRAAAEALDSAGAT